MIPLDLPAPGEEALAHCARLAAVVRAELAAAGGWLPFARYMELVLYAPGLGYYSAGATKFGAPGDFVTAPELSPVFGRCVAVAAAAVLDELGGGDVLELGAGTGRLCLDVLGELERRGQLPARYDILEVSADLRQRQAVTLAALSPALRARVHWLDRLPEAGTRVVLANEVADALPVERFRRLAGGVEALGVVAAGSGFAWDARPAGVALCAAIEAIEATLGRPLAEGYVGEWSPLAAAWIAGIASTLRRGAAFILDYGLARAPYYAESRDGGTLACFYRHRMHSDPFVLPGLQDLTAWVDYTGLAEAALGAGLEVAGYTTQAHFLIDTGFDSALAAVLGDEQGLARHARTQAALTLVLPGEMGERFKCLALAREVTVPRGFRTRDFTAGL